MTRILLGIFLACWGAMAQAATVTLLNQTFYVEMVTKGFDSARVFENGDLRPFHESATMTWAELGIPGYWSFDLGMRFEVDVLIEADDSLAFNTFSMKCSGAGAPLCPSYSFLEVWFDGTTIKFAAGGPDFYGTISRFGGWLEFVNDASGSHTLPDGRPWLYESGYRHMVQFQPVPLPASAWMLMVAVLATCSMRRRRAKC